MPDIRQLIAAGIPIAAAQHSDEDSQPIRQWATEGLARARYVVKHYEEILAAIDDLATSYSEEKLDRLLALSRSSPNDRYNQEMRMARIAAGRCPDCGGIHAPDEDHTEAEADSLSTKQ